MPREAITLNNPTFKVADTELGLASGTAYECQITSAVLTPQPVTNTIPATGCAPQAQSPGRTGWQLNLAWLEDWFTAAGGGLSSFAYDNDGMPTWYELTLDTGRLALDETGAQVLAWLDEWSSQS